MESTPSIKQLDSLLKCSIKEDFSILNTTTSKLPIPGESYNSQLLELSLTIFLHKSKKEEKLQMIAKIPTTNEEIKQLFGNSEMFRKEAAFYNTMLPALREFQKEQGVADIMDFFAKCYGARINLTLLGGPDGDAVVLLEDLRSSKFVVFDRFHEFDLEVTEALVKNLAVFHAVPIATKLLNPRVFEEKILPYLRRNGSFDHLAGASAQTEIDFILKAAERKEDCLSFLSDIEQSLQSSLSILMTSTAQSEPFATISHNDLWVNNILINYETDNLIRTKILDYQLMDYGSPGNDIIFLLFTSVQMDILRKHYDNLILLYYNTFVSTLKCLKCDTTPFTFSLLQEEIRTSAKKQFFRMMMILRYLLSSATILDDSTQEAFYRVPASNAYNKRAPEILVEYLQRKWL